MTISKNTAILILAAIVLIIGLGVYFAVGRPEAPGPTPTVPVLEPAASYYPAVSSTLRGILLAQPKPVQLTYQEVTAPSGPTYRALIVGSLISTGHFDTMNVDLGDGRSAAVDVVWVYDRNTVDVIQFPLAVGAEIGGEYTYFRTTGEFSDRASTLEDAKAALPRGRTLTAIFSAAVDASKGALWDECSDQILCQIGAAVNSSGNTERMFEMRLLNKVPSGWLLAWNWDPATEINTDPTMLDVVIPDSEVP